MPAPEDYIRNKTDEITKDLMQNYQNKPLKGGVAHTIGKLNGDGTATLPDGSQVKIKERGMPGVYAHLYNMGNGTWLADCPSPVQIQTGGTPKVTPWVIYKTPGSSSVYLSDITGLFVANLETEETYSIPLSYLPVGVGPIELLNRGYRFTTCEFSLDGNHIIIGCVSYYTLRNGGGTGTDDFDLTPPPSPGISYVILKDWYIVDGQVTSDEVIRYQNTTLFNSLSYNTDLYPHSAYIETTGGGEVPPSNIGYAFSNTFGWSVVPVLYTDVNDNNALKLNFFVSAWRGVIGRTYQYTKLVLPPQPTDFFYNVMSLTIDVFLLNDVLGIPTQVSLYHSEGPSKLTSLNLPTFGVFDGFTCYYYYQMDVDLPLWNGAALDSDGRINYNLTVGDTINYYTRQVYARDNPAFPPGVNLCAYISYRSKIIDELGSLVGYSASPEIVTPIIPDYATILIHGGGTNNTQFNTDSYAVNTIGSRETKPYISSSNILCSYDGQVSTELYNNILGLTPNPAPQYYVNAFPNDVYSVCYLNTTGSPPFVSPDKPVSFNNFPELEEFQTSGQFYFLLSCAGPPCYSKFDYYYAAKSIFSPNNTNFRLYKFNSNGDILKEYNLDSVIPPTAVSGAFAQSSFNIGFKLHR